MLLVNFAILLKLILTFYLIFCKILRESEDTVLLIIKQVYGYEDTLDSNVELNLTENQQQQTSWLTQMATQAISSNVQKTFSYFQMGLSQSLTNVLPSTSTSASLKK